MRRFFVIVLTLLGIACLIFIFYLVYNRLPPANFNQDRIAVFVAWSFPPLSRRESIQIINVDLPGLTPVINRKDLDWEVEWSPDGDEIVFFDFEAQGLYKLSVNGSGRPELLLQGTRVLEPSWSPDGTQILYSDRIGSIHVFNLETQETRLLVPKEVNGYSPEWSPDGKKIVLTLNDYTVDAKSSIAIINSDGSNLKQLTPNDDSRSPKWSSDGQKILFEKAKNIYTMDLDGANIIALTNDGVSYMPDWSPDGTRIVFISSLHEKCSEPFYDAPPFCTNEIRIMNADGTDVSVIRNQENERYLYPVWAP